MPTYAKPRGGAIKGGGTITVTVSGVSGIRAALAKWLEPELTAELDAANKRAAQMLAKEVRAEASGMSKRMSRAVRVKRARTGKPGWVVGSRRKTAFFWPFLINGTRDHTIGKGSRRVGTRKVATNQAGRKVRGIAGRALIEPVMSRYERQAADQIDNDMTRMTGT